MLPWDFLFIVLAATIFLPLCIYVHKAISFKRMPTKFGVYINTSQSNKNPGEPIITSDIDTKFKKVYQTYDPVVGKDTTVTHTSLWVQQACQIAIDTYSSFNLVVDSNRIGLPLQLIAGSTDKKSNTIDLDNFDSQWDEAAQRYHIRQIELRSTARQIISISGLRISEIVLNGHFDGELYLANSWVKSIRVEQSASNIQPSIHITNSWVGTLNLKPRSCRNLEIKGGGVRSLECGPLYAGNQNRILRSLPFLMSYKEIKIRPAQDIFLFLSSTFEQ